MSPEELREQIAKQDAAIVVGQFTIEPWAAGWMATAFEGGPGSSIHLFGRDRADVTTKVADKYGRGGVPMNAIPSSQYFADALRYRLEIALRERAFA